MSDSLEWAAWALVIFIAYVLAEDKIHAFIQRWRNRRRNR